MIWLAVPEIVVQGFAAFVVVLVVTGVLAVVRLGSRARPRRVPVQRRAGMPVRTSAYPVHLEPTHRNGTSRERLRR